MKFLRTILKLLPFIICFAILQGITCASAQCSYIGVTAGDSYDYIISGSEQWGGLQETISGNIHVHVDNVTQSNPCSVGLTITQMQEMSFSMIDFRNGTYSIQDSSTVVSGNANLIISTNVVNKTYHEKHNYGYESQDLLATWDSNGMLVSLTINGNGTSGMIMHYVYDEKIQRINGVTTGPDPAIFTIFIIIGITFIILKKRRIPRESSTTT